MRILFVTNNNLSQRRSGPAVRIIELARLLARAHQVTVATAQPADTKFTEFALLDDAQNRKRSLRELTRSSDVVVTQGLVLAQFPLLRAAAHLVADLYDPFVLEYLANPHPRHPHWGYLRQLYRLNQQLLRADFFLCANQRQRDYWLGSLAALGRLTSEEYRADESFRRLIDVVPFGLPSQPPQHTHPVMRGVLPGIGREDLVLLWGGGIWQWLDPITAIRAIAAAARERGNIKLVFLGTQDPNPQNRAMSMVEEARRAAAELGVLDRHVFFPAGWVPYEERQNWLLEADIGVSAHHETVEARFAFRTRVLDYVWAGLPMILTAGDHFSEWAVREGVGRAIAAGDTEGWKNAILRLAGEPTAREKMRTRLREIAGQFTWETAVQPLLHYCAKPYKTAKLSGWRRQLAPALTTAFDLVRSCRAAKFGET